MAQRTARKPKAPTLPSSREGGKETGRETEESSRTPRAIWSGTISFGLVSIPVRLYTATESHDVHFHLLHKKDGVRLQSAGAPKTKRLSPGTRSCVSSKEIEMAVSLIENLSDHFDPQRYHDEYQAALKKLIDAKVGGAPLPAPPSGRGEKIVDLMEALRASVEATRKKSGGADGKAPVTRTRTISSRRRKSA